METMIFGDRAASHKSAIEILHSLPAIEWLHMVPKQERIISALVVANWLTSTGVYPYTAIIEEIITAYGISIDRAHAQCTQLLMEIKSRHASSSAAMRQEFKISTLEKSFLFLDIPGDAKSAQSIWYPLFDTVHDRLQIRDPVLRHASVFSGLGDRELGLCIVAYAKDRTRSFVFHEHLHIDKPGLANTFFDEMITESLAYADSGFVDLAKRTVVPKDLLPADVNTDYYEWLSFFLALCRTYPRLFPLLKTLYENGADADLVQVGQIIGESLYQRLLHTQPDSHCPLLPTIE